jgi:hypothetical protein
MTLKQSFARRYALRLVSREGFRGVGVRSARLLRAALNPPTQRWSRQERAHSSIFIPDYEAGSGVKAGGCTGQRRLRLSGNAARIPQASAFGVRTAWPAAWRALALSGPPTQARPDHLHCHG